MCVYLLVLKTKGYTQVLDIAEPRTNKSLPIDSLWKGCQTRRRGGGGARRRVTETNSWRSLHSRGYLTGHSYLGLR